jgi:hypothetical protein
VAGTIYGQPPAQRADPRAYGRTPDAPIYRPRAYEPGGMPQYATPRPGTYDARGSYDARPPRQAAPPSAAPPAVDRGAPAPPPSSAPGREHAVPRDGGRGAAGPAAAPVRRGRG